MSLSTTNASDHTENHPSQLEPNLRGTPRLWAVVVPATLALVPPATGATGLILGWTYFLAVVAVAGALAPSVKRDPFGSVAGTTPLALLVLVVAFGGLGSFADLTNTPLWAGRVTGLLVWGTAMATTVVVAATRSGRVAIFGREAAAGVTLLLVWGAGVAVAVVVPLEVLARNVGGGTDLVRHILLMRDTAVDGYISTQANDYPRGLHAAIAPVWSASGGSRFVDAWLAMESMLWLLFTLLVVACVLACVRLARAVALPWWVGTSSVRSSSW